MKSISRLLPILGVGLFILIIWRIGPRNVADVIYRMDGRVLLMSPVFVAVTIVMKTYKWRLILRASDIQYPFRKCIKAWSVGFFAGLLTPAKIGDAARVYYVKRDSKYSATEVFSTLFIDRIIDILGLLVFVGISILLASYSLHRDFAFGLVIAAMGAIVIVLYLFMKESLVRSVLRPFFYLLIPQRFQNNFRTVFRIFYQSLGAAKRRKHLLLSAFAVNILGWFVFIGYLYLLAMALHVPMSFLQLVVIMPIVSIIELLPISVSGMGTREAALIGFFQAFSIPVTYAVPFSIMYLLFGAWLIGVPGMLWWLRDPVRRGRREA